MLVIRRLFFIALFFYLPFQSSAWGMLGHRIIGEIADSYLTPKAQKNIRQLLGTESLAMTANWPDFIKSDPAYNYLGPWHYINFEDGFTYSSMQDYLAKDTAVNAYTKVNFMVKKLKDKALPRDKQVMYLRLLIHIIGDLHQPMHAGRLEDMGGNRIRVQWFNEPTNLHSVWDEKLINYQQLSYTEYTRYINHTTVQQRKNWQAAPIDRWIFESYEISRQLYEEIKQPDQKLTYRYNFDHIQTVNERLLKGGVRLAGILNQVFG